MLSKREVERRPGCSFTGQAVEEKFVNVTLKKAVDWVELELNRFLVSVPSARVETGI
jgi:hypothetical protein